MIEKLKLIIEELEKSKELPRWVLPLQGHIDKALERRDMINNRRAERQQVYRRGLCANLDADGITCNDPMLNVFDCTDPQNCKNWIAAKCKSCGGK